MRVGERILLAASRQPGEADLHVRKAGGEWTAESALRLLESEFPAFDERIRGRRVLDFGSGAGYQAVALAMLGAGSVVGVEPYRKSYDQALALVAASGVADRVTFVEELSDDLHGQFDIVISQNSMEHYGDPGGVLDTMARALAPGGALYITFGPPWLAPHGSHMHFFTRLPWVNLLFSEETVMRVRSRFRSDGARRYGDIAGGLNQMTVAKFERLVRQSGLRATYWRYAGVRGADALTRIPGMRELFTNQVSCILTR